MDIEPGFSESAEYSESASELDEPIDLDKSDSEHVPASTHNLPPQDFEPKIEQHRNKELHIWAEEVRPLTRVKYKPLTNLILGVRAAPTIQRADGSSKGDCIHACPCRTTIFGR